MLCTSNRSHGIATSKQRQQFVARMIVGVANCELGIAKCKLRDGRRGSGIEQVGAMHLVRRRFVVNSYPGQLKMWDCGSLVFYRVFC